MKPQNFEETVVWYYIIGTFVLYFAGAQFITGPAVAWILFAYLLWKLWQQNDATPDEERITIPLGVWVWVGSMLVIGFVLIVGHFDFGYGVTRIVKSFINFFLRTWALLALFPLAGCLKIRPQLVYRAVSILGLQCLIVGLITYAIHFVGMEGPNYTSTVLAAIGGNDPRYYTVDLFMMEFGTDFRLLLFAPWAPALAFAGNVFFCLSSQESNRIWRWIGMIGSAFIVWGSASRLGLLCLILLPLLRLILVNISRPVTQILLGMTGFVFGLFGFQIITAIQDLKAYFNDQRSSSTLVRATLARMGIYHWQEAPIWGHAMKDPQGPQVVQKMPLGSHHTWIGVLYVHGIVGFIALAIPMIYTFFDLLIKAQTSKVAQTGLSVLLVILLFSFGENLETLAYLYWTGLLMIGIALKEKAFAASSERELAVSQI